MEELLRQLKESQKDLYSKTLSLKELARSYNDRIKHLKSEIYEEPASINSFHYSLENESENERKYAELLYIRECLKKVNKRITSYNRQRNEIIRQINQIKKEAENDN